MKPTLDSSLPFDQTPEKNAERGRDDLRGKTSGKGFVSKGVFFSPIDADNPEISKRLAAIIENSDDAIITKTLDGIVTHWNLGAERMFGYTAKEAVGQPLKILIPGDRPVEEANILAGLARGEFIRHFETVRVHKDGTPVDVSATISPLRDPSGKIKEVSTILRDISERKQVERELRFGDQRYRSLVEATAAIVWEREGSGDFKLPQPSWTAFTGQTFEELRGWGWLEAVHPDDRAQVQVAWLAAVSSRAVYDIEYQLRAADQSYRHMRVRAVPIVMRDGKLLHWFGVDRDITEHKQSALELFAAKQQLQVLVERLHNVREEEGKRIARELHDDLGQHLTALNLEIFRLEKESSIITDDQRSQFVRMHAQVDHTIHIVQKIASELRLGQIDIFGLSAAIEDHLNEFTRLSAIPCRITQLDEVPHLSDRERTTLFRIFQEALTNISRHSGATEVEVRLQRATDKVTLSISDNGRGISSAEMNGDKAIGLLGMHERAQIVHGHVTIVGRVGVGTTVLVTIPQIRAAGEPA